jgi:hypothetical protein
MAFCFTSQMIIAGSGGGSALPLFKNILCISNNMKHAENIRVLSLGDCNIAQKRSRSPETGGLNYMHGPLFV